MSRFSQEKRKSIEDKLLMESEKLFESQDLKKVTVDDIVKKVDIGKGTFYHFYENKEHIYLELYMRAQADVFKDVEEIIEQADKYQPKEFCYLVMVKMLEGFSKHPILYVTDEKTWRQLTKKVRADYNLLHKEADQKILEKVKLSGVRFKFPEDTVMRLMQTSCLTGMILMKTDKNMKHTKVMIRAIIDYIVKY